MIRNASEPSSLALPWTRTHRSRLRWLAALGACLLAIVAIRAFWHPGLTSGADMVVATYRAVVLDQAWHDRVWFPRIAPALNFGYGGPLFEYYSPLASYLILAGHWLGTDWIAATKAVFTLSLLSAVLGAFFYANWLFDDIPAGLLGAAAYGLAPYLLFDVYQRGALAETLALGLLPWLFFAAHRSLRTGSPGALAATALMACLLMLSHNVTALFVLPLLVLYMAGLAWIEHAWRPFVRVLLALALGLALSAFYWLPALVEVSDIRLATYGLMRQEATPKPALLQTVDAALAATALRSPNDILQKLAPFGDLVQPRWTFDYWGATASRLGLWQGVFAILALVGLISGPRERRLNLALLAAGLAGLLCLQLPASALFWQAAPLARYIQYPWRLLGPAALFIALLVAGFVAAPRLPAALRWAGVLVLVAALGYGSLRYLDPSLSPLWYDFPTSKIGQTDMYERGRGDFALFDDYVPANMGVQPAELTQSRADSLEVEPALPAVPDLQVMSEGPFELALKVHAEAPFSLRLPRIFFPSWQVTAGGQTVRAQPAGPFGLVGAELPAGDYSVSAHFADTPVRVVANWLSALALLALGWVIWHWRAGRVPAAAGAALLLCGLTVLSFVHQGFGQPPHRPVPYAVSFQDEIRLLGYDLDAGAAYPGGVLKLRFYWLAEKAPATDYKVFLHLSQPDDGPTVAQSDSPPMSGYSPTSRWGPGEIVVDEQEIKLGGDVRPGTYQLLMGLYRPDPVRNLSVRGASQVLPGDRVVLAPVVIRNH